MLHKKISCPKEKSRLAQGIPYGLSVWILCMGPLPETESGSKYVLVAVDYFTRWVEAYEIPNQEATTVARKLVDEMFSRFSPPEQLHSDQGRQFESTCEGSVQPARGEKDTYDALSPARQWDGREVQSKPARQAVNNCRESPFKLGAE